MGQIISNLITSSDDNLETFSLIWVDASVDTVVENRRTQDDLRSTFNQLKPFADPKQCEEYIKSASDEDRIVLIVSGQLGQYIVPRIHLLTQLLSIYVYCQDRKSNEQWAYQYPKIKAVVTDLKELIARIQFDHEKRQQSRIYEALPISIFDPKIIHEKMTTDLQGKLVQSQLLINSLLHMQQNPTDKNELISISKQIYKNSKAELSVISEFEQKYSPERAIRWYTRDSFLSRLLNKALRTQNIDLLFLLQFFIVDVREQLEKFRCKEPIQAYRSQLMSKDELKKLQDAKGKFITINSFLSATIDNGQAMAYLENSDGLERIFFEIHANPQIAGNKPFARIKSHSADKEEEILFMLGSIFEILRIKPINNGIWLIQLQLCSDSDLQLDLMSNDKNKLLSFGHVLVTMGKLEEAEIYYQRLLDGLQPNHPDVARCCEALAAVFDEEGKYDASLQLYERALSINLKATNKQSLDIVSNYNSIGEVYQKKGDYNKAREFYDIAVDLLGEKPIGTSLAKQAVCFNNIGIIYQEQHKYKEALEYYMKAYKIREEHFRSDETSLGMSFNNIGNAYYFLRLYKDAIYYYQEALKIYRKTLPPQHPKFASTYNNIGAILDDQGHLKEALAYYQDALKIYRSISSDKHPNIPKIEENIQRIQIKMTK